MLETYSIYKAFNFGAAGENRTRNHFITSEVLYHWATAAYEVANKVYNKIIYLSMLHFHIQIIAWYNQLHAYTTIIVVIRLLNIYNYAWITRCHMTEAEQNAENRR